MSTKLTANQIRDLLKTRAHCLHAGFLPTHPLIVVFNKMRDEYILQVGLPTYLSQMLGSLATVSIQECILYDHTGDLLKLDLKGHQQPVQRFIGEHFWPDNLPCRVEIKRESRAQMEVRYL